MSPERWSQVRTLLERVLARPHHEREEFLRHRCAGDDDLYNEVWHLVEAKAADPSLLDSNGAGHRQQGPAHRGDGQESLSN